MFMFSVFPALERLVIGSRFYGSFSIYYAGRRPGQGSVTTRRASPYYDRRWSSAQILENLMRMLPNRSELLQMLILKEVGISEDDLFTLLCELDSLEAFHLRPPDGVLCTGGRCLTRLVERSKTDREAALVLPRLRSLSLDTMPTEVEEGSSVVTPDINFAFRELVDDPRRGGRGKTFMEGTQGDHEEGMFESYQVLQEAILYIDGEEKYWRSP
ncbi:hypothetical protein BKA70DRAFT_1316457 [Coprinopsis sp. MPI-PUGE-AT-0042]|nr:hypothetical protein BKA70DRAFT_1316457 [Coprinopsis sp. MPI-PUGE-AT-0042]